MARAFGCGIVVLALLVLAACGPNTAGAPPSGAATPTPTTTAIPTLGTTPTPSPATSPAPTPTPGATQAQSATCPASQLSLSTAGLNAGAGAVEETFIFTNTGQTSCTLSGYPGMQMLGMGGQQIPTKVVQTSSPEPMVTLAPGGTASFLAQWHSQTGYTTPCQVSQQVQVTPPGATAPLTVTAMIQACPDGSIDVKAVAAGSSGGQ